jgi:hypothetical protein
MEQAEEQEDATSRAKTSFSWTENEHNLCIVPEEVKMASSA